MPAAEYYPLVALGYALLTIAVGVFEAKRIRASGPDLVSMFIVLFVVQCTLPGVVIYVCLPFVDAQSPTGVAPVDRIYAATDLPAALLVLGLTAWFVAFFYAFTALISRLLKDFSGRSPAGLRLVVTGSPLRLLIALALGLGLSLASFYVLGDSLVERYTNLILFRAGMDVQANLLNSFGFGVTQAWAWLSVPALFVMYESRGRRLFWYLCLIALAIFVLLGVSRRAVFIPVLLAYLTLVLFDRHWRLKWLVAAAIPLLLWIAYGKEVFGAMAFGGTLSGVVRRYATVPATFLRAASDIGLTIVESLGSINLLDLPPRFGIDHLLSVLRQIPTSHRWLGTLPVRIVRLSTIAFAGPTDEDIPPGSFGQMWMDFRVFGPIVWALLLSVPMSIGQHFFARTVRTRQAVALFALITFVVTLPLTTGSYDFTFSTDIYVLLLCILLTFRFVRIRLPDANSGPTRAART